MQLLVAPGVGARVEVGSQATPSVGPRVEA